MKFRKVASLATFWWSTHCICILWAVCISCEFEPNLHVMNVRSDIPDDTFEQYGWAFTVDVSVTLSGSL